MVANQIYAATCAVPAMRERRWGRLLTVASSAAVQPIGGMALSNSLRASLLAWTQTLAAEVAGHGVTCHVLLPGRIATMRVPAQLRSPPCRAMLCPSVSLPGVPV